MIWEGSSWWETKGLIKEQPEVRETLFQKTEEKSLLVVLDSLSSHSDSQVLRSKVSPTTAWPEHWSPGVLCHTASKASAQQMRLCRLDVKIEVLISKAYRLWNPRHLWPLEWLSCYHSGKLDSGARVKIKGISPLQGPGKTGLLLV